MIYHLICATPDTNMQNLLIYLKTRRSNVLICQNMNLNEDHQNKLLKQCQGLGRKVEQKVTDPGP